MITYMQFIDEDISLNISELNTDDKIHVSMYQVGQELNEYSIFLSEPELLKLKSWIDEVVKLLDTNTKSEAP